MVDIGSIVLYRDSAGVLRERPDDAVVDALRAEMLSGLAAIPQPADTTPKSEMTGGTPGQIDSRYARADHQHPRLTSTTYATLNGSGQATVAFSRSFTNKPGINLTETDAATGTQPLVLRATGWVQDTNGLYTGVTIAGSRAQLLPTLTPLSGVLTLLSQVISGVNGLVTSLTSYNVFGGNAAGATVSVIAIARSDVPAT